MLNEKEENTDNLKNVETKTFRFTFFRLELSFQASGMILLGFEEHFESEFNAWVPIS